MGYESRVYVVSENDFGFQRNGKYSAETIAVFNLCCIEQKVLDVFKEKAACYVYADGSEIVTEDCYGDELKSVDILTLYNAIQYSEYWRTTALKEFLHGIISNKDILSRDFDSLRAYHYGY